MQIIIQEKVFEVFIKSILRLKYLNPNTNSYILFQNLKIQNTQNSI